MREDFLHYLWKFKKFETSDLYTTSSEAVQILHSGDYTQTSGPDFFNAQLIIGSQKWAGNIEIHLKSSDWYLHNHEKDSAYENVILHVVWEHDSEIFRSDNSTIPVLELKNFTSSSLIENFNKLSVVKSWIYCENQIQDIDQFTIVNWLERIYFERLKQKSDATLKLFRDNNSDWEAVLFLMLAKNFGLNSNGEAMLEIAQQIPMHVIRRESENAIALESLFFGYGELLTAPKEDVYFKDLVTSFKMLRQKYQLPEPRSTRLEFFKHRPVNFPTIRLAQLANLYGQNSQLFSKIMSVSTIADYYDLFNIGVSKYWQTHFQFDREVKFSSKKLSKSFIDLLILNTIVPLRFAYAIERGDDINELLLNVLQNITAEENSVTAKFESVKIKAKNALESQALLQLKNDYCMRGRCLECAIGVELLKQTNTIV